MLLAADQGAVVNTASVNALWASLGSRTPHSAYSSAKFAVRGFTESLVVDFRRNAWRSVRGSSVGRSCEHWNARPAAHVEACTRKGEFADYEPVSSESAASIILEAVQRGEWRVVIGDDAAASRCTSEG